MGSLTPIQTSNLQWNVIVEHHSDCTKQWLLDISEALECHAQIWCNLSSAMGLWKLHNNSMVSVGIAVSHITDLLDLVFPLYPYRTLLTST